MDNNIRESDSFRMAARETWDILLRAPFRMQGCFHERAIFLLFIFAVDGHVFYLRKYICGCVSMASPIHVAGKKSPRQRKWNQSEENAEDEYFQ